MMDVSTAHSARKTTEAVEALLSRLQRQRRNMARHEQHTAGKIDGTIATDDSTLSADNVVKKMLMDTTTTRMIYNHIGKVGLSIMQKKSPCLFQQGLFML